LLLLAKNHTDRAITTSSGHTQAKRSGASRRADSVLEDVRCNRHLRPLYLPFLGSPPSQVSHTLG